LLEVTHLTKTYGALTALSDVSISVRRGEILGLIGPNGAGKTTLFECVAGLLARDTGSVLINDKSGLFYLPDAIAPWPSQPVRWALRFTQHLFGGTDVVRNEMIERLRLEPFLDQPMRTLSKGQRKRALLAIGLLTPHALLLADEPFEGLDLSQTREMAALLRGQIARGRTLFLSIHQIADAARVCDRFVLLSGGRVRGQGTLAELSVRANVRSVGAASLDLEEVFLALT
jgi:ABC-type multidrug transport system ATPase subunit